MKVHLKIHTDRVENLQERSLGASSEKCVRWGKLEGGGSWVIEGDA